MRVTEISARVKRDVRHRPYIVSQCECTLTAHLEEEDSLEDSYKELHSDTVIIVEEMVERERRDYANEVEAKRRNKERKMP